MSAGFTTLAAGSIAFPIRLGGGGTPKFVSRFHGLHLSMVPAMFIRPCISALICSLLAYLPVFVIQEGPSRPLDDPKRISKSTGASANQVVGS